VSEDPIRLEGGDVNLYRYVRNVAPAYRDPRGLFFAVAEGVTSEGTSSQVGLYYAALPPDLAAQYDILARSPRRFAIQYAPEYRGKYGGQVIVRNIGGKTVVEAWFSDFDTFVHELAHLAQINAIQEFGLDVNTLIRLIETRSEEFEREAREWQQRIRNNCPVP
jgi:hypothetical protein